MKTTKFKLFLRLTSGWLLLTGATLMVTLLYAKTTVYSTHAVVEFTDKAAAYAEAERMFTNKCSKVVLTLERNYTRSKETDWKEITVETYRVEGYRREGSMTE